MLNSRSDHQDSCRLRLQHFQLPAGGAFNLAGVGQPGLFQLQAAPFCNRVVVAGFECAELDGQMTALMACIDNAQGAAYIYNQYDEKNQ